MNYPAPIMAEPLHVILSRELAAGNEIAEISAWPPKCSLLVILKHAFRSPRHTGPEVELVEVNDPHYWKAEYRYRGGDQVLACGFK